MALYPPPETMQIKTFAIARYLGEKLEEGSGGVPLPGYRCFLAPPVEDFWLSPICPTEFYFRRGRKVFYADGSAAYMGFSSYTFGWSFLRPDVAAEIKARYREMCADPNQDQRVWFSAFNAETNKWHVLSGIMEPPTQQGFNYGSNYFVNMRVTFSRLGLHKLRQAQEKFIAPEDLETGMTLLPVKNATWYYGGSKFSDNNWDFIQPAREFEPTEDADMPIPYPLVWPPAPAPEEP